MREIQVERDKWWFSTTSIHTRIHTNRMTSKLNFFLSQNVKNQTHVCTNSKIANFHLKPHSHFFAFNTNKKSQVEIDSDFFTSNFYCVQKKNRSFCSMSMDTSILSIKKNWKCAKVFKVKFGWIQFRSTTECSHILVAVELDVQSMTPQNTYMWECEDGEALYVVRYFARVIFMHEDAFKLQAIYPTTKVGTNEFSKKMKWKTGARGVKSLHALYICKIV